MPIQRTNPETLIGLHAIIQELDLKIPIPAVRSVITGSRKTRITDAEVLEQYPKSYQPIHGTAGQLRFALRYEPIDLGVYKAAFARIPKKDIESWIQSEPNGIFARRAWYLRVGEPVRVGEFEQAFTDFVTFIKDQGIGLEAHLVMKQF